MAAIASHITSLTVVYSFVYSDTYQRKHQSSASLAFVRGIHRDRWILRTNGQLRRKCFHLMTSSWFYSIYTISMIATPHICIISDITHGWISWFTLKDHIQKSCKQIHKSLAKNGILNKVTEAVLKFGRSIKYIHAINTHFTQISQFKISINVYQNILQGNSMLCN